MKEITFNCTKCGLCCKNLLDERDGNIVGLCLTKKETRMFDPKYISPQVGIGKEKVEKIIGYQLNVAVCPHLGEKNNCEIYDKRPLVCQTFPFEPARETVSRKCPQIKKQIEEGEK